jgi:hypothetical protein
MREMPFEIAATRRVARWLSVPHYPFKIGAVRSQLSSQSLLLLIHYSRVQDRKHLIAMQKIFALQGERRGCQPETNRADADQ